VPRPFTAIRTWHKDSSGIHQTTTQSPLTMKHFHHRGTKICVQAEKKVFVADGWQLTSRRHLLPTAYQPGAS